MEVNGEGFATAIAGLIDATDKIMSGTGGEFCFGVVDVVVVDEENGRNGSPRRN